MDIQLARPDSVSAVHRGYFPQSTMMIQLLVTSADLSAMYRYSCTLTSKAMIVCYVGQMITCL